VIGKHGDKDMSITAALLLMVERPEA